MREVVLAGSPNVGKSVIFNRLTGKYVSVSNYPGTTVEIARGYSRLGGLACEVVDTPGLYSLLAMTEEERVTREFLFSRQADVVIHVADAKNVRRMLNFTLELMDAGLPVVLNLNLMDEAAAAGVSIDSELLADALGIPVVPTAAVKGIGIAELKKVIGEYRSPSPKPLSFSPAIEEAVRKISLKLAGEYGLARRLVALLLLQNDEGIRALVKREARYKEIQADVAAAAARYRDPLALVIAAERQEMADGLLALAVRFGAPRRGGIAERLDRLTREPLTGIPILLLVLYYGLYQFVGVFGAGYLVDTINRGVFDEVLTPALQDVIVNYIPWQWLASLLAGEYGLFTMGLRYAVAIILPVVGTFFLAFAVLEDCGYLPRLAMLMDRVFRQFGLNGRAVIPVTLGLGCGTMAVFVARTLETPRERLLATFLLSLAIPCSAQLGVVMALLAHNGKALLLWFLYMTLIFAVAGWLAARLVPGKRSPFYMELPPFRLPSPGNVAKKAYTRMLWYFVEIIPVFFLAAFLLWLGDRTGLLAHMMKAVEPVMAFLGLPPQAAQAFLLGFFRRDYGAAGLYDMAGRGLLTDWQLVGAAVTLTLFVPCMAQFLVMVKERGPLAAFLMTAIIVAIALTSGWLMHQLAAVLPL
ncbi:MAG TPA: ferrous iron transport protein B [Selenomonadales bacterium]|nr:ferrous iron transport protein B [Selenomonadales bacterium]